MSEEHTGRCKMDIYIPCPLIKAMHKLAGSGHEEEVGANFREGEPGHKEWEAPGGALKWWKRDERGEAFLTAVYFIHWNPDDPHASIRVCVEIQDEGEYCPWENDPLLLQKAVYAFWDLANRSLPHLWCSSDQKQTILQRVLTEIQQAAEAL